jgi:hypothetical protein
MRALGTQASRLTEPGTADGRAIGRRFAVRAVAVTATLLAFAGCAAEPPPDDPGTQCDGRRASCGETCVDVQADPLNCGACGVACGAGLVCSLGACSSACDAGLSACGAACVALASDALHCGACGVACGAGRSCVAGACLASGSGGTGGAGGSSGAAGAGASGETGGSSGAAGVVGTAGGTGATGGAGGSGGGVLIGAECFPICASAATDDDGDGYGYEMGRSCVVAGSAPALGAAACEPPPLEEPDIPPGDGFYVGDMCHPRCASDATDADPETGELDGWGYEMGRSCIVAGSAPAMSAVPCIPEGDATGDGYQVEGACVPPCEYPEYADADGWGFEAQATCVVGGSNAATQSARCTLTPRTDLPPPGDGYQQGETCFPPCSAGASDVTADGYGWDANRTCIVPDSKAAIQGLPCVPPPSDVTGSCPMTLACPVVGGVTLECGCTWVDGLAERKAVILGTAGATQYFLASAMMETATLTADYALGDNKTGDAFNAGLAKQNWGMIRQCHGAWNGLGAGDFMTSTAMNSDLALDIQVYNECRDRFGAQWWAGHRSGNLNNTNTTDVLQFKGAMDWTDAMLTDHLTDDVRFWVSITPI